MAASSIMPVGCSKAEMGRENWPSELCVVQNSWTTERLQLTVSPLELGWFFRIVKTERREPGFISLCLQDTCELPVLGWGSSLCLRHFLWCKELWAIVTQCPLNCEIHALTLSRYLGFKVLTAHTCPTSQPKEQSHNLRKSLECAYNSGPCIHTASTLSFDGMRGKGIGEEQSVSHQKSDSLTCGILYSSRRGSCWRGPCNYGQRFPLSLAVVVRDSLIPSREPKQGVFQSAVTTFKGTVEIITQGQVGEEVRLLVDLLHGKEKNQNILIILEGPPKQRGQHRTEWSYNTGLYPKPAKGREGL